MADPDEQARERIRRGDAAVADDLLARDHGVADLLAQAAAAGGTDPAETTALAWQRLVTDVRAGVLAGSLRAALLVRVAAILTEQGHLDTTAIPSRIFFAPPEDRWAGWWVDDHALWPPGTELTPAQVMTSLRRVPVSLRILLVLRDAAGLAADEAEPTVSRPEPLQAPLLDTARLTYLAGFDPPVTGSATVPAAEPDGTSTQPYGMPAQPAAHGGTPPPPAVHGGRLGERSSRQAVDLNCQVVFGLVGRWHDGDMPGRDRDSYEQHLLFCPPCLAQVAKVRTGLTALREAATARPSEDLRARLHGLIRTGR